MQSHPTKEDALRAVYGYDAFRGVQAAAIDAVVGDGVDVLVVMATGGGKSLCYQIPPLVLGRAVVVVSPLVSLMQDQVAALEARGLTAAFLGSAQSDPTVWARLGQTQYVYATPELAATERFREALRDRVRPCLVAIDEAHCVSEWGFDFRTEYRDLHELRAFVGDECPILAVTATATERTRRDIATNLGFRRGARTLVTTVDRPNLTYTVARVKDFERLVDEVQRVDDGATIVYVPTVREVESIASRLAAALRAGSQKNGRAVAVGTYHGQMDAAERARVHRSFSTDALSVVVATLAFGMGIDKPDVRLVVHWGAPKTVESYYQQAGRAGRDGDPARCVLFTAPSDWPSLQRLLTHGVDEATKTRNLAGLRGIRTFVDSMVCRRVALATHFGEEATLAPCGRCDACTAPPPTDGDDASGHARVVLTVAAVLDGRYGVGTLVDVCRGTAKHEHHRSLQCCGAAKDATAVELRHVVDACRTRGLVAETTVERAERSFASLVLTDAGRAWLADPNARLCVVPLARRGAGASRPTASAVATGDVALFQRLRGVRREVANGCAPYMVCSDATLRDMIAKRPRTREELLRVAGIGEHKANLYGEAFLRVFR